jgi:hypothetical protein
VLRSHRLLPYCAYVCAFSLLLLGPTCCERAAGLVAAVTAVLVAGDTRRAGLIR